MRASSPPPTAIEELPETVWLRPLSYTDAVALTYGDPIFIADDGTATPGHVMLRYRDTPSDPPVKIRDVKARRGASFTGDVVGHFAEVAVRSMFGTEINFTVFDNQDAIDAAGSGNASLHAKRVFMRCEPDTPDGFEAPVTPVREMVAAITLEIADVDLSTDVDAITDQIREAIAAALPANVTITAVKARKVADKYVDVFQSRDGQRTQVGRAVRRDLAHQLTDGKSWESVPVPEHLVARPFHPRLVT